MLTASTCDGTALTCTGPAPAACPGNYQCADSSSCRTSCNVDADCTTTCDTATHMCR
jgi:hypothetical protein